MPVVDASILKDKLISERRQLDTLAGQYGMVLDWVSTKPNFISHDGIFKRYV